jgi:hypothetical protein
LFGAALAVIVGGPIFWGSADGGRSARTDLAETYEDRMQVLLLVAVVLICIATALASAAGILSLLFRLISRMR